MVSSASRRSRSFRRTATGFTTWPATSCNGAVTGIGRILTRGSSWRPGRPWCAIPKARPPATIPARTSPSGCIAAAHSFASTSIAPGTWWGRAAKVTLIPPAIISASAASRMGHPWRERSRRQNECHWNPARPHATFHWPLAPCHWPPAPCHSPLATSHAVDKYDAPSLVGNQARKRFHVMVKPGGSACNLDCTYCFYLSKEHLPNGPGAGHMSDETLEKFIQQYIAGVTGPEVVFSWQGGEPTLMGLEFFRKVVA